MKAKTFRDFLFENARSFEHSHPNVGDTIYHVSARKKLEHFENRPAWFSPDPIYAEGYKSINSDNFINVCKIVNGTYLNELDVMKIAEEAGYDYEKIHHDMIMSPTHVFQIPGINEIRKKCDGFLMGDYDPRDPGRLPFYQSLVIFDPHINVRIVE